MARRETYGGAARSRPVSLLRALLDDSRLLCASCRDFCRICTAPVDIAAAVLLDTRETEKTNVRVI